MTSPNVTLYPINEVAAKIGVDYEKLRGYLRRRHHCRHQIGNRLYMSQDQIADAARELRISSTIPAVSRPKNRYDTGTHVSARNAVMMVCVNDNDHMVHVLGGGAADLVRQLGIGTKKSNLRTAPYEVAKADLPILAIELHKRGYKVRPEYLPADTQQAIQPPLPISVSRTDETAKLLGLTTEQAAELYLSLAAAILERLK